ncbi:MAG: PH domain-containing protein [Treponema sp.]|jgi:uncharacterized membrane protein YdbT with pleckstrin-like domain|nr:PH domain-containing protein [Treponema sp.]
MKFVRKKNLHQGEELLYIPRLHGIYIIRHMIWSLPLFAVLFVLWAKAGDLVELLGLSIDRETILMTSFICKYAFLAVLAIVLLLFLCSIFQYVCTEYGVTNRRLMIKKGVFRQITRDIPTDRIESISCTQGIMGRIFHYGTLCISGIGGIMPVFYMVARPYAFRRKIVEIIEKNKVMNVVHGNLPRRPKPVEDSVYLYGSFVRVIGQS